MKKRYKIPLLVVISIWTLVILGSTTSYIPRRSVGETTNPHINSRTLVASHRAGADLKPENTMMAIKYLVNNGVHTTDIFEMDLKITACKQLILLHDGTFDRTSNSVEVLGRANTRPSEFTLEELYELNLNLGYKFIALDGSRPFEEEFCDDLRPATINEVFAFLENNVDNPQYILEIKDSGDLGLEATDILVEIMKSLDDPTIFDRVILGSFHGEVSRHIDENHPEIIRSAGIMEVLDFYFRFTFGLSLRNVNYRVLQIPYKDFVINFGKRSIITFAHHHDIAVQFWTINDEASMRHLISIGADAIMTDRPDLLYTILQNWSCPC
jgi:glycerophosphoryl diester phosphodiesterase